MLRSTSITAYLGLLASLIVPAVASADVWSIQSDCEEGDWSVVVHLDGLGSVDVSCLAGAKIDHIVDTGALIVTDLYIEATSALGTFCELPAGGDDKSVLMCSSKGEDDAGLEFEEEIEVEVEREVAEREEVDEEPDEG